MLQAFLMQRALAFVSAILGGFGVFCAIYSFEVPELALQALLLLGAALLISHFSRR
jgi:multisubunit Na+/H+ antiporter MnhB subunit